MSVTQSDDGTDLERQSGIDELRGPIGWTGPPRTHLIEAGPTRGVPQGHRRERR